MLLVLSNKLDAHADYLIGKVAGRFPVLRLNTDTFLEDYEFSLEIGTGGALEGFIRDRHGHAYDLSQAAVGWYRKPDFAAMAVSCDAEFAGLVRSEAASFVDALFALPDIRWVNPLGAEVTGRSKPAQLLLARQLGFAVPETIITNHPGEALDFGERIDGGLVAKSVHSATVRFGEHDFACITRRVDRRTLAESADSIAACPTQLQREIPKDCDVRVTVVGDAVFACRIDSQHAARTEVDWRVDPDLCRYSVLDLPEWARDACREIVRQAGLHYGAIDLVLSAGGEFVFLENNPGGQYLWLEIDTGLPITEALIGHFQSLM